LISINGLLAKILVLVIIVATISLGGSYAFVTMQQKNSFSENIRRVKDSHRHSAQLLFQERLQRQELFAEELVMLSGLRNKTSDELRSFFEDSWPIIKDSFSLSSMSFTNGTETIAFGEFPSQAMNDIQNIALTSKRPHRAILCHDVCALSAAIPSLVANEQWVFSFLKNINSTIFFLNTVVGSDVALISPVQSSASAPSSLSQYEVETITGNEKNSELFAVALSESQISSLRNKGLQLSLNNQDYFVWLETISDSNQNIDLMFIRNISLLIEQQKMEKQQVIFIFFTLTFGILLFLILFSIIPISRLNQLKRAIKLIGAKEYDIARDRLGDASKSVFNDELHELEDEFRHAIDLLETYEQKLNSSQKRLVRQATIDPITGLYTRSVLIEDVGKMTVNTNIKDVAAFFLDLDGFKPINDNLGHEAGDIMLKKIGYRLKGLVNKSTKVYRIGGDEFVICYCNFGSVEDLGKMADSIVELFSAPFHIYDTNICISASIGICMQEGNKIDADQLLRYADIAMYQAKEGGKNRYEFFDDSMRDSAQRRFTIKNDFVSSLASNHLHVVFQPIVSSRTRDVVKLEALCRWHHPELGFIPPPVFVDVLEESENINTLFEWIVKNIIDEILFLDSIGRSDIVISINLSPSQLGNENALDLIERMIEEYNVDASRLELEITETSLIANFAQAKLWVEKASKTGFRIAIDDFGAGYSSLSYLTAFPYDTVKLDRSLLNNIDVDTRQQRIVGSLTQMLHGLSVPIVAEGAETEAQFEQLKILGCDYIQGYLISKPIRHSQLVTFLEKTMQAKVLE
jgi:diguanylate cyclase (GGDEF)-like protein